ncbi:hypothetical protein BC940DRAFT_300792 [Gongronella butleri]|nr:hypothetical protein BC940DRAFT_300792 [Gongronella butleri]
MRFLAIAALVAPALALNNEVNNDAVDKTELDKFDLGGVLNNALWPAAFAKSCMMITKSMQDLMILMTNPLMNGLHCTEDQQRLYEAPVQCHGEGLQTTAAEILWPLAFNQQQSVLEKLNAQTKCLRDFIEKRQRMSPGPQTPYPTVSGGIKAVDEEAQKEDAAPQEAAKEQVAKEEAAPQVEQPAKL